MPANRVARLVSRATLGEPYFLLTFSHTEVAREARAGQFVMLKAGLSAEPPLRRPFSIMEIDPERGTFSIFVKEIGDGTRGLCRLPNEGEAMCLGPLGRPFAAPEKGTEALLVAGGYGIAPFHLFVKQFTETRARVFYGGRTAADLRTHDGFGVEVEVATEDGSLGVRGRVTDPLEKYLDRVGHTVALYACGPEGMLHAVAKIASRRGLSCQVSLDPWMGCGVGTCLSCVVRVEVAGKTKYACACTAGPVFEASTIVWE